MRKRLLWSGIALAILVATVPTGLLLDLEISAIRLYQRVGSPIVGMTVECRYRPTCSHYALNALLEDGLFIGNARTAGRLAMCSPIGWAIDQLRGERTTGSPVERAG